MNRKYGSRLFLILLLCSLALLLRLFWTYVSAIILALLITSVFYPVYSWTKRILGHRKNLASIFMVILIFIVLVVPLGWFVSTLSNEAFDFYNRTKSEVSLKKIQEAIAGDSIWAKRLRRGGELTGFKFTPETIENLATGIGRTIGLFLYKQLSYVASNLLNFLVHFFLMMLLIFYLFRDASKLKDYLAQFLPLPRGQLEKLADKFQEMGSAIIIGNGLSGIVQGILGGLGFFMFGISSPFLWGTVLAFMAFLPIIGASVIFVPATAILLIQGKTGAGIAYLIYNVLYSSIIEYFIKPRVIGKGMQMNSLLVFIGIIGGIKLFGILGIIYGPLIITIFLTLAEIYGLEYKEKPA